MKYTVAGESELALGSMLGAMAGELRVVVFRHDDGSLTALEDRCSHADVKLSRGSFKNGEVHCPAHGARFDAKTGQARCMPAVCGVRVLPVTVSEGSIVVDVE